jgi:hypothetical protein
MARSVTLLTLRTRIYRRADLVGATSRFPTSEVDDEINESIAALLRKLANGRGHDHYEKEQSITTVAGQSLYQMADDFWELISVEFEAGGGDIVYVEPFSRANRPELRSTNPGWSGQVFRYRIRGKTSLNVEGDALQTDNIEFLPIPQPGRTIKLYYLPAPIKLTADDHIFDGIAGLEEWVVLDVAAKLMQRNNRLDRVAALRSERDVIEADVIQHAPKRSRSGPPQVVDVLRSRWHGTRRFSR